MQRDQLLDDTTRVGFVFSIASETPNAPADYRAQRMRAYLSHHGENEIVPGDARFLLMTAPTSPAPLADVSAHPELTDSVRRQHAARIACALHAVERETPLLKGETLEQDEFTYLTAPYNGAPARTAVLRRQTNYGELLYVFSGVTVDPSGRLLFQEPASLWGTATPRRPVAASLMLFSADGLGSGLGAGAGSIATTIAKGIASGMLSTIGGAIAGGILDQIFPPGVPSYFDEVYDQIKRIVGAELQQQTIDQINGAINNIKAGLATEYKPAREGKDLNEPDDRQFLFNLLQKYETTYLSGPGGMLGTLMGDKYAKPGFGAFLLGAGLHLSLYQEMANVDPSNKASGRGYRSPLESSYGRPDTGTVAVTAKRYAEFAEKVWPQLLADRAAKITQSEGTRCAFGDTTGGSCRNYAWFRDDLDPGSQYLPGSLPTASNRVNEVPTAESDKNGNNPGRDQLIQDYKAYAADQAQTLTDSLNDPAAIAKSWRQLMTTPIKVS